mmetsp:Transcript_29209/g.68321  ORF Transcript_29209/g.68321 Transcript_29209/m.68321 type:complete len:232 (+) Transcript_29209:132-827(+)
MTLKSQSVCVSKFWVGGSTALGNSLCPSVSKALRPRKSSLSTGPFGPWLIERSSRACPSGTLRSEKRGSAASRSPPTSPRMPSRTCASCKAALHPCPEAPPELCAASPRSTMRPSALWYVLHFVTVFIDGVWSMNCCAASRVTSPLSAGKAPLRRSRTCPASVAFMSDPSSSLSPQLTNTHPCLPPVVLLRSGTQKKPTRCLAPDGSSTDPLIACTAEGSRELGILRCKIF